MNQFRNQFMKPVFSYSDLFSYCLFQIQLKTLHSFLLLLTFSRNLLSSLVYRSYCDAASTLSLTLPSKAVLLLGVYLTCAHQSPDKCAVQPFSDRDAAPYYRFL